MTDRPYSCYRADTDVNQSLPVLRAIGTVTTMMTRIQVISVNRVEFDKKYEISSLFFSSLYLKANKYTAM